MATVIAFTSGKKGVGKTTILSNLALSLIARHLKVCIFNTDNEPTNLNMFSGFAPRKTIDHALKAKNISEIIEHHPSGFSIIHGIKQTSHLNKTQISALSTVFKAIEKEFDYILIDTPSCLNTNILDYVASAHYRIIVITPESASLTDSFALMKMLMMRGKRKQFFVLVNKVDSYQLSQFIFKRFQKAVKTYLNIEIHYFGYLTSDPNVNKAFNEQVPVALSYPNTSISCGLASLADIIKHQFIKGVNLSDFSHEWSSNTQTHKDNTLLIEKTENDLSTIYTMLEDLSKKQLKELNCNLKILYEKKYSIPLLK